MPHKYRDINLADITDSNFYLDLHHGLKRAHKYFYQVQGQMAIADVESCWFVVWMQKSVAMTTVERDRAFWDVLVLKLQSFFLKWILPELVTRHLDQQTAADQAHFCLCQQPEEGRMIACDNNDCTTVWFHFKCVNITRKPRGKWFCPSCSRR